MVGGVYPRDMTVYRIQRGERLDQAAARIWDELAQDAKRHLTSRGDVSSGIHEARKDFKKARGLARLVRSNLDDYHRINRSYRDAGRELAPIRDAHAFFEMFATLEQTPAASKAMRRLRGQFAKDAKSATKLIKRKERHRVEEALSQVAAAQLEEADWQIEAEAEVIESGLARTYGRGKSALETASRSGSPTDLHEARKRVKYLWYQVRLIRGAAPSVLGPMANSLRDVSHALGDAHDLALMVDQVESAEVKDETRRAFRVVAMGYMKELEQRAVGLARRLYVEEPDAFAGRLGAYWRLWNEGDELETGHIEVVMESDEVSVQFA